MHIIGRGNLLKIMLATKELKRGKNSISSRCGNCGRIKSKTKTHSCLSKKEIADLLLDRCGGSFAKSSPFKIGHKINVGRKYSKETIEKIRRGNLGKKRSAETRAKLSVVFSGRVTSEETKRKLSVALGGKNSYNWKGGITSENARIRRSFQTRDWRRAVFERDNYTCQKCNCRSGNGKSVYLNAHHIKPFYKFPELRFEVRNGLTLCKDCHYKIHSKNG